MQLQWIESAEHTESLAVCLRAVLAGQGCERTYAELVAALGLGSLIVAVAGECPAQWALQARDAGLRETSELYGVRLRELHPTEAAEGLAQSAEFAGHFRDSYVPLIRRALEHEQLVLAWQGWPEPQTGQWGVIDRVEHGKLAGCTIGFGGRPTPFHGPALQVFVVEKCGPVDPDSITSAVLWSRVAGAAAAQWSGQWTSAVQTHTGDTAYGTWIAALSGDATLCAGCGRPLLRCHGRAAGALVSARLWAAEWLCEVAARLDPAVRPKAEGWAAACRSVAERLAPFAAAESDSSPSSSPLGRADLRQAIAEVRSVETSAIAALASRT